MILNYILRFWWWNYAGFARNPIEASSCRLERSSDQLTCMSWNKSVMCCWLPGMSCAGQLMSLPPHCCWINLAAALKRKLSWDAVTADTIINCWRATPVFRHLLNQTTPTSPRTNKWVIWLLLPPLSGRWRAHCSVTSRRAVNDNLTSRWD